jgi:hypothetical protein
LEGSALVPTKVTTSQHQVETAQHQIHLQRQGPHRLEEFPGKKSTFTVADGAIHVKNGPGDLQTVGKYQNFILQLDAISNGKHLNSGIFFRCKDNEYQNGYEAQIFNRFSKDPTQKYLVEEYDPQTNKLLAKKEVMSTAFDFGTGAIYRRVPARKEMSKDGEWFGMTIVAHGNHLATWVKTACRSSIGPTTAPRATTPAPVASSKRGTSASRGTIRRPI